MLVEKQNGIDSSPFMLQPPLSRLSFVHPHGVIIYFIETKATNCIPSWTNETTRQGSKHQAGQEGRQEKDGGGPDGSSFQLVDEADKQVVRRWVSAPGP
jgi:hypothetical protein